MNKIFGMGTGLVVLLVAIGIRYLYSKEMGIAFVDISRLTEWEQWVYGVAVVWFLMAFWNTFGRRRCPQCRTTEYSFLGEEELDRWVGSKQVRERVGDNSWGNRSVTTTFVKIKRLFECNDCEYQWSEVVKRELN